ncbi:hypothetical protein AGR8A_pAt30166 [Agrobacterium fabrum str. J-07]|nr:hypothetical protein AGR8A_pAt30166 [Agrobacterium fabrum str. J-07]
MLFADFTLKNETKSSKRAGEKGFRSSLKLANPSEVASLMRVDGEVPQRSATDLAVPNAMISGADMIFVATCN